MDLRYENEIQQGPIKLVDLRKKSMCELRGKEAVNAGQKISK
jgi:hypothetical protein